MKKQVFFWAIAISLSFIACSRNHSDDNPATNSDSSLFSWWYILIFVAIICIIFNKGKIKKLLNKLFSNCKLLWKYDRQQEDDIYSPKEEIIKLNKIIEGLSKEIAGIKDDVAKLKKETRNLNNSVGQLKNEVETLNDRYKELHEDDITFGEKFDSLQGSHICEKENKNDRILNVSKNQVSQQTNSPIKTLYAESIIDDCFAKIRDTPNEDSTFVLHLTGEDSANFSIYKPAYQRVLSNPSFLEGCERQILGNAMQLEITSEGKAQRVDSNNKWKVINKLNVIIR